MTQRHGRRWAILIVVSGVALAAAAVLLWREGTNQGWGLTSVDDSGLQILVARRPCDSVTKPFVSESPDSIEIIVKVKRPRLLPCSDKLVYETVSVDLDQPLGDRALVGCRSEGEVDWFGQTTCNQLVDAIP